MKYMLSFGIFVFAAAAAWASSGIAPRAHVSDYPVSGRDAQLAIGAKQLSKSQVRDAFVPDLDREYVVIEVGVFPDAGADVTVTRDHFTLATREGQTLRPFQPQEVAEAVARRNGWDRTSTRSAVGVAVETPGGRDIYTDTPTGGVHTTMESTTTIGSRQSSIERVEKELRRKMFPEGTLATATAGYLLFRRPAGKPSSYELRFKGDTHTLVLLVPAPK